MEKNCYILGLESSCDETAAAIVANGRQLRSRALATSIAKHQEFGGVVPELASRAQLELILPVIEECLDKSGLEPKDLDAIAVTAGPGLVGSLLVGITAAKALAFAYAKPLIGVHHLCGHVAANYLLDEVLKPPFLALIISGGHSHIAIVHDYCDYELLARTRDDAVGEVYDKLAREMGLGYPGGPVIDKLAKFGDSAAFNLPQAQFKDSLDFSFSGLKTACLEIWHKAKQRGENSDELQFNLLASFQATVVSSIISRAKLALAAHPELNTIVLAGGVAANSALRRGLDDTFANQYKINYPSLDLCTDNAAMIAAQAYYHWAINDFSELSMNADSRLELPRNRDK